MSEKNAYIDKLKAQLDVWAAEIDKLEAKAKMAGADARIDLERRIKDLRSQQDSTQSRIAELENASEDAWEDLKEGVESAWNNFRKGLEDATSRFK
jgi:chromosome segregation ATPase